MNPLVATDSAICSSSWPTQATAAFPVDAPKAVVLVYTKVTLAFAALDPSEIEIEAVVPLTGLSTDKG